MKQYFSLVTFSHTVFAMPFAIIGLFLGFLQIGEVSFFLLFLVVLCMIFARNAAMGFNRYADREIDAKNERTAVRDIPSGKIKANHALFFVLLNAGLFILTTWFINPICFYLSPIALAVVLGYSYTKRFTFLCHWVLGLGLALAPVGAWLAATGEFAVLPILYGLLVLFWVSGFDIIYAMQDVDFDRKQKLFSIPVAIGRSSALRLAALLHAGVVILLFIAGALSGLGWLHWIGVAIFIAMLIWQHTLVSPNDLSKVDKAFFTSNGFASLVFGLFVLLDIVFLLDHSLLVKW